VKVVVFIWGYDKNMYTVFETPTFQKQAVKVWTVAERHALPGEIEMG
jgi:hypothetical protein